MILIVDDDPSVTTSLGLLLKQHGYTCRSAGGAEEALASVGDPSIELVLQDMNFSRQTDGQEGLDLLARTKVARPDLPVILMTAWGSIPLAVQGVKAGAIDFIAKPWSNAQILQAVGTALGLVRARAADTGQAPPSREDIDARLDVARLVGHDSRFLRILDLIGRVAPTDASVLITGESGTGKELVAQALHDNGRRRGHPFVKVNLGGISSTLFESEMFGHVRGAFTDAREARKGRFEIADGGTIFLDEIGDLDLHAQVKLLRVLQDRTYEVLGSSATRTVDVRVVAATNRDLPALVGQGLFREDLLYRLNLITIRIPPLRERQCDVPVLARHLLAEFAATYRRGTLTISDAAMAWLEDQPWPGNVRQLRQTIERAVLVLDGSRLDLRELRALQDLEVRDGRETPLPAAGAMTLDEMERAMIVKCVRHWDGNLSRVAEALGLSRAALYRRLRKYRIDADPS
jgi:two-component system, NtrC family, response regulator